MKIGILYIGIGRYACFWSDFYKSCEKYFVTEAEKQYYVFTDHEDQIEPSKNVKVIHQDDMGWPCNSLFRFKMFHRIKEELEDNDYLFFFNSNAQIIAPVKSKDILPQEEDFSAMCIESDPTKMGHEWRPESVAYIAQGEALYYFSGALNGGKCKPFIKLIETCNNMVDTDLRNGIMPIWHDESILNRFLVDKHVKIMCRNMGKPANWREPRNAKIILRRKENVLGNNWLRNYKGREHTNTWLRKLLRKLSFIS